MVGEYNKVGSVFIGGYFRHRMVTFQQGKEYSTFTATSTSATTDYYYPLILVPLVDIESSQIGTLRALGVAVGKISI